MFSSLVTSGSLRKASLAKTVDISMSSFFYTMKTCMGKMMLSCFVETNSWRQQYRLKVGIKWEPV